MRTISKTVCTFLCVILIYRVSPRESKPFGAKWTEVEELDEMMQSNEEGNEEEEEQQLTSKEKITKWMLRRLEGLIISKIRDTSFVELITGKPVKENVKDIDGSIEYDGNTHVNIAAFVLFIIALMMCAWCVIVRHLLRGVMIILAVAFFIFLLVLLAYPSNVTT